MDIAGDTGGRGRLGVTIAAIGGTATTTTVSVEPEEIARRGTYEAAIPLDPAADKSPTLTVKVITGDHWIWPLIALIALIAGALLAYWLVTLREMVRPKRILQLALTRAQARNKSNRDAVDKKGLTKPYTLEDVFPVGAWDCNAPDARPEALELYCAVEAAKRQEDLDALASQVADVEVRVNAWPSVCAKADALSKAKAELDKHAQAVAIATASQALVEPAEEHVPTDGTTTKAYMQSLDDQVKAAREWLNADALLEEGLRLFGQLGDDAPSEHDPARWRPDLRAAKSLEDLERCQVVAGLCRDVHVLRTLVIRDEPARARLLAAPEGERPDARPGEVLDLVSIRAAPPALEGPDLTKHLVAAVGASDLWTFVVTTAVVALAYLAGVYSDTYGSLGQYATAFAAGAGATFAANWKLLPWYSRYKPPKAA